MSSPLPSPGHSPPNAVRPGAPTADQSTRAGKPAISGRPWLGVLFRCHNAYARAWMTADGTRYAGTCPRCGAAVEFRIGAGGTSQRFFVAG